MSSVVVLDHIMFWNTKTFRITNKIDADATDAIMGLNENEQEPGGINKNTDVTDEQEPKGFFTNTNVNDADSDGDIGFKNYAILKNIIVITGTQDYP